MEAFFVNIHTLGCDPMEGAPDGDDGEFDIEADFCPASIQGWAQVAFLLCAYGGILLTASNMVRRGGGGSRRSRARGGRAVVSGRQ